MMAASENLNILIVEDNPADLFLLEDMLLSAQLTKGAIHSAVRLEEAKALIQRHNIGVVLLDLSLPDSFGLHSLKSLRQLTRQIPIIILTGLSDTEVALEALNGDAQDYLVKGEINTNLLVKSIEYSIERKKIEERMRASEEKYRQMFYRSPFPMWINETDTLQILEVNDAAIQKYGYSREEFLQLTLEDLQQLPVPVLCSAGSGVQESLWQHKTKKGDIILVDFTYYSINYFGRTAMQALAQDMTEKIRLKNELHLQKQKMLQAVLNAQESERKLIGRELHDNINQMLAAVKLSLGLAQEQCDKASFFIDNSLKHTVTAMEEVRKLSKELIIPGNIRELGIVASLEDLMKELLQFSGIAWRFAAEEISETILGEELKLHLYRIVQEQLTNVLKHAQATSVQVLLQGSREQISLTITDNGRGFDPAQKRCGIGLTNITSRVELYGGTVHIHSQPGKGCTLEAVLQVKTPGPCKHMTINKPVLLN